MPILKTVRELHTMVRGTAFSPRDPLPRLATALLEDAVDQIHARRVGKPIPAWERGYSERQLLDQLDQWVQEEKMRPASLAWCVLTLNLAGMELSEERVRAKMTGWLREARERIESSRSGRTSKRRRAKIVPTVPEPAAESGSRWKSDSRRAAMLISASQ